MKEQSLQQIMNEMACRLDVIRPEDIEKPAPKSLDELEAFIQIDPLLANLNKQYLEAKHQRKELVALNGADDAMAEVIIDMEDSAWCAMQTRYIELRQDGEMMAHAQRLMREVEEAIKIEKAKEKDKEFKKFMASVKIIQSLREQERRFNLGAFEATFIILIFKMFPAHENRPVFNHQALLAA